MRRLASNDADFSIRFDRRRDEIGEMARALAVFRSNTIELLESRKRLSNQAEVLARSLDKERALATEQRNFISTISHEFRTPLMAIDGHAQRLIMTRDRANPPEVADRAQKIRSAVFRMTSLVGSLVNAVELAHGELPKRIRRFDLREMLHDLSRYYDGIGIGRGLQARIGDLPAEIIGDPQLLYQVFSNVISNAFKYSSEDGIVTLSADSKGGFVEVTIEDRGLGVPRDELDRIREPYYRASNVGSISGTGMGLHLVNEIVRQHGGRLEIESEEGRGTRVVVILPAEDPSGPSEPSIEHDPVRRGRSGDGEPARGGSERTRLLG
jgi:signal transduction histidine kinase